MKAEVADLVDQWRKLSYALACLHTDKQSGAINQIDFDVRYYGYCFHMAKIRRDVAVHDYRAASALIA